MEQFRVRKLAVIEDEDGLLRVKVRLGNTVPEATRMPIILSKSNLSDLIVDIVQKKF